MASRYGRKKRRNHLQRIAFLDMANKGLVKQLYELVGADDKVLSMRVVIGDRLVMLDWKYALSENVLRDGMTDAEVIHIAEQVAIKFGERMMKELGRGGQQEG